MIEAEIKQAFIELIDESKEIDQDAKDKLKENPSSWVRQIVRSCEAEGYSYKQVEEMETSLSSIAFTRFLKILEQTPLSLTINHDTGSFRFATSEIIGDDAKAANEYFTLTLIDAIYNLSIC